MDYSIDKNNLKQSASDIINVQASELYNKEGESLFDLMRISSGYDSFLDREIDAALGLLVSRLGSKASIADNKLSVNVPDLPDDYASAIKGEIDRYVTNLVASKWFTTRYSDVAPFFSSQAEAALNGAISKILTRKKPTRQ